MSRAIIVATGAALPDGALDNTALGARLGVTPEWIESRTGIDRRPVAPPEVQTSDLAVAAARQALARAEWSASSLDLIVVATVTPDRPLCGVAARVQHKLGATCGALDVGAACAGFIYALVVARGLIAGGIARRVLVVGADLLSRSVDPTDRDTSPLFGDGAGAVVLEASSGDEVGPERGLIAEVLGADGSACDVLGMRAGGTAAPPSAQTVSAGEHVIHMRGREVYRRAVKHVSQATREVCARAGWSLEQVDWLIPHQANRRVIDAIARRVGLPPDRCVVTIREHGNTSAASIPLALDTAAQDGRLQRGDRVVLAGLGAGLVWGAVALRW